MRLSPTAADATVRALADRLRDGRVRIMAADGLLVECGLGRFRVVNGQAEATDTQPGRAVRGGVATSWQAVDRAGVALMDGSVGAELTLPVSRIDAGDEVRVAAFRLRQPSR